MNKDLLKIKNIEKYLLKDGDFLVERSSQKDFLSQRTFELEANAKATYLLIVDETIAGKVFRDWTLNNNSQLKSYRLFLKDQHHKQWSFQHEIKEGAKIDSHSLVLALAKEKLDLESIYNFSGYASFGRIKIDSLLAQESELKFYSDVNVLPSAQKSDTRVDMTVRLEGKGVKSEIIPGLNIAANDVKAGHSAGTFRLKVEDLFYLRSRGLNEEQIRFLFVAYLSKSFVTDIDNEQLKEELVELINNSL